MCSSPQQQQQAGNKPSIDVEMGSIANINVARNIKKEMVQSFKTSLGLTSSSDTENLFMCAQMLRQMDLNERIAFLNYLKDDGTVDDCLLGCLR